MTKPRIDVILPGLFQLPLPELNDDFLADELPALNHILRFAQRLPNRFEDFECIFADSLGLADQGILPFASAVAEVNESSSQVLLCQATHFKPDIRNAFVVPLDQLSQTQNDINSIINDLCELFKEDCDIIALKNGLYLMRLKHCEVPGHYPHILSVIGRKVDPYIKQSREHLPWYRLINEIQMFMHSHEVNQRRLLDGLLPINSLWCWGAGEFVVPPNPDIQCYCDDPVLVAYANRAGLSVKALTELTEVELSAENIYIDLCLLQALKLANNEDLQILLSSFELKVFKPLVDAARSGRIQLRLRAGYDYDYRLSRFSSLKRWRKASNLMTHSI